MENNKSKRKEVLRFGDSEPYNHPNERIQRVYYKDVEVGALVTKQKNWLAPIEETFISMNLRYKTVDAIKNNGQGCKLPLIFNESEDRGFFEMYMNLDPKKKYCDLLVICKRIFERIRPIHCATCGKLLFYTDSESDVGAGLTEAMNYGFVYKMPFLYNSKVTSAFYCDKICWGKWLTNNSSVETRMEARDFLAKVKDELPKAIAGAQRGAVTLYNMLMEMKMSKDGAKKFAEIMNDEKAKQEFIQDFIEKFRKKKI